MSPQKKSFQKRTTKNRKSSNYRSSGRTPQNRTSDTRTTRPSKPNNWRGRTKGFKRGSIKTHKMGAEQVEGRRAVLELLLAGARKVHEIYFLEDIKPASILSDIETIAESEQVQVLKISKTKFFQLAQTETPQGVIARAVALKPVSLEDLTTSKTAFLLVVDGILDTANLGSLMRSAECAGVTGIVLGKHRSASITAAATKSAAGAIEYLPIALVSSIPQAIDQLKESKIWTVGLDQDASSQIYGIGVATEPLALVVGAEATGLKSLTKKRVDSLASIPLQGKIRSLNAAVAAAVACFEIQRLRNNQGIENT